MRIAGRSSGRPSRTWKAVGTYSGTRLRDPLGQNRLDKRSGHFLFRLDEPSQEPNLASVVNVVEGYTLDQFEGVETSADRHPQFAGRKPFDGPPQQFVLFFENPEVRSPSGTGRILRTLEPVASLQRKGTSSVSSESPSCDIFPIGGVNNNFPDIVPSGLGSPGG